PSGHTPERQKAAEYQRVSEETPPRCGATLDGVTRPSGRRGPRWRQAPDGHKSGGTNPRIAAGSTVVSSWLRLFQYRLSGSPGAKLPEGLRMMQTSKTDSSPLTSEVISDAGPQAPPMAEARHERRLLAVACTPMIMIEASPLSIPRWYADTGNPTLA